MSGFSVKLENNNNSHGGVRSGTQISSSDSSRFQSVGAKMPGEINRTTTNVECILLTNREVASSYSTRGEKQRGGWADLRPKTHPVFSGRHQPYSPQVPSVPKAVAKRKSNCAFHGSNGSLFTQRHAYVVIKCEHMTLQFKVRICPECFLNFNDVQCAQKCFSMWGGEKAMNV